MKRAFGHSLTIATNEKLSISKKVKRCLRSCSISFNLNYMFECRQTKSKNRRDYQQHDWEMYNIAAIESTRILNE